MKKPPSKRRGRSIRYEVGTLSETRLRGLISDIRASTVDPAEPVDDSEKSDDPAADLFFRNEFYASLRMCLLNRTQAFKDDVRKLDDLAKKLVWVGADSDGAFQLFQDDYNEYTRLCRAFQLKWRASTTPIVDDEGEFLRMYVWDRAGPVHPVALTPDRSTMDTVAELAALGPGRFIVVDTSMPIGNITTFLKEMNTRRPERRAQSHQFRDWRYPEFREAIELFKSDPKTAKDFSRFIPKQCTNPKDEREQLKEKLGRLKELVAPTPGATFP